MDYYEDEDLLNDDDELDLLELVSVNANSADQYLIFRGSNDEAYGINVSKIKELIVYKDLEMIRNKQKNSLVEAAAQVRDEMVTLINFDKWFGNKVLEESEYELVILSAFGGKEVGIIIKSVEYIVNITSQSVHDKSVNNANTNFISKIKLNSKETLCTIFDCDKMLLDLFEELREMPDLGKKKTLIQESDRYILFADDSKYVRKMVVEMLKSIKAHYKTFENGLDLFEELKTMSPDSIGLIITDLEMPLMDGIRVIKNIKALEEYKDINIIVHTNMSNDILGNSLFELGASGVVDKIDISKLASNVEKYFH